MTQKSAELLNLYSEMKAALLVKNQAMFAKIIGFGRNHVANVIKSEEGVPQEWIDKVKDYIAKNKKTRNATNSDTKHVSELHSVDVSIAIRDLKEAHIRVLASVFALEQEVDKLVSDHTKKSIAVVSAERRKAADIEADRLFVLEAKKRQ